MCEYVFCRSLKSHNEYPQASAMSILPYDYLILFTASLSTVFGRQIALTRSNLETIPSDLDPMATLLQLNFNFIVRVERNSFLGLTQLRDLHMNGNDIYFIDDAAFLPCSVLQLLNLQHNKLTILPEMSTLPNLIYLAVKDNDIYIQTNYFSNLSNIQTFQFSRNIHVEDVPYFNPNTPIRAVYMDGCPVKTVPDLSRLVDLVFLLLDTDTIVCDSKLCWLKFESFDVTSRAGFTDASGWRSEPKNSLDPDTFICNSSPHTGILFRNINPIQLQCYNSKSASLTR